MSALFEAVADILENRLNVERQKVLPTARFNADLGLDSLADVELAMALHKRFGVDFSEEEMSQWVTVDDVLVGLEHKGATIDGAREN